MKKIIRVAMAGLIILLITCQAKAVESQTVNAIEIYRVSIRPGSIAAAIVKVCIGGHIFMVNLNGGGMTQVFNRNGNAVKCK